MNKKIISEKNIIVICFTNELLNDKGSFDILNKVIKPKKIKDDTVKYNLMIYSQSQLRLNSTKSPPFQPCQEDVAPSPSK